MILAATVASALVTQTVLAQPRHEPAKSVSNIEQPKKRSREPASSSYAKGRRSRSRPYPPIRRDPGQDPSQHGCPSSDERLRKGSLRRVGRPKPAHASRRGGADRSSLHRTMGAEEQRTAASDR